MFAQGKLRISLHLKKVFVFPLSVLLSKDTVIYDPSGPKMASYSIGTGGS